MPGAKIVLVYLNRIEFPPFNLSNLFDEIVKLNSIEPSGMPSNSRLIQRKKVFQCFMFLSISVDEPF